MICNQCNMQKEGTQTGLCCNCGKFGKTNSQLAKDWWSKIRNTSILGQKDKGYYTDLYFGVNRRMWKHLNSIDIEQIWLANHTNSNSL